MKKITVPAAGQHVPIKATGLSVQIFEAPDYQKLSHCPRISFEQPGLDWPIQKGDNIPFGNCAFGSLVITGTPESAGDEITIQTLDVCVEASKNSNPGVGRKYIAGQTKSFTSTDAAKKIPEIDITRSGDLPIAVYISARGNNLNYGFVDGGASPDQSDEWHLLTAGQDPIEIEGWNRISKLEFASAAAGTPGELVVSTEY